VVREAVGSRSFGSRADAASGLEEVSRKCRGSVEEVSRKCRAGRREKVEGEGGLLGEAGREGVLDRRSDPAQVGDGEEVFVALVRCGLLAAAA